MQRSQDYGSWIPNRTLSPQLRSALAASLAILAVLVFGSTPAKADQTGYSDFCRTADNTIANIYCFAGQQLFNTPHPTPNTIPTSGQLHQLTLKLAWSTTSVNGHTDGAVHPIGAGAVFYLKKGASIYCYMPAQTLLADSNWHNVTFDTFLATDGATGTHTSNCDINLASESLQYIELNSAGLVGAWTDTNIYTDGVSQQQTQNVFTSPNHSLWFMLGNSLGGTPTWTALSLSTHPPGRVRESMAYDTTRLEAVMFGGDNLIVFGDTWTWNGSTWTQRSPLSSPPARRYAAMAYDSVHQQTVLFGGTPDTNFIAPLTNDTWVWDGMNWTQKFPATSPPARFGHDMAYDSERGQVVLFGGQDHNFTFLSDTWIWDGTNWTQKFPATSPPQMLSSVMAFDPVAGNTVLLQFSNEGPVEYGPHTWLWDGTTWSKPPISDATEPVANQGMMVSDIARGQVLLFGGDLAGTTWLYSSAGVGGTGTISVTTNLTAATFTIIGPATYTGTGTSFTQTNAPSGSYTITFGSVNGCSTPASQTSSLASGGTLSFTGNYQNCVGNISIQSNIANATFTLSRTGGASVTGGGPFPITLPNMPIDTYTITFNPIAGYLTPVAQTQLLAIGGSTVFQGNFSPNGTGGLGRITITTNLSAASFGVISTSNTAFTPFTRSGTFFDTLYTVPSGTYQISFTPLSGYFTPPSQTLTLAPGGTIQFSGIYSRTLVALFTGFSDRPTINPGDDGVTYPDQCAVQGCPAGMAALASELRVDPTLTPGIYAKTFTFYDERDYVLNPVLGPLSFNCFAQVFLTTPVDPACRPPLAGNHQIAQAWIGALAPTPDDRIVIIGHSYGGNRARLFAQQLLDTGYEVDGLVTADPIDWSVCGLFNALGVFIDSDCDFSNNPYIVPDSLHYLLSFTQTQSQWLKGYNIVKLTQNYPYTILNDAACLPNLASVDNYCSHVHLASRSGQGGGTTGDTVHDDAIALVKSIQQSPNHSLSQIQVSNLTVTSATISWMTGDDTLNGKVIFSLDQNFGATQTVTESGPAGKVHSVTLSSLQSNQTYYFTVTINQPGTLPPLTSDVRSFRTSPTVPNITTTSWSLSRGTNLATLEFIIVNSGAPATGVSISSAKIGLTQTSTILPMSLPDITSIQPALVTLTFPLTIGSAGTTVAPTITLKYAGGTVTVAARVQIQ